ncbi:MAG TPA: TonB-dependent receptor [Steroidobacteraceae bacterium]|nr:TonB-dependent receptor [Steroidobacteraceae bacterium]
MQSTFRLRGALAGALGLFAVATLAAPAAAPSGGLEEVTVTAQRREEQIQQVPIAVTALTDTQLARLNITQTLDVMQLVPNSFASNNTGLGTANVYSIRGLNNTESIATFDPPVGTYVDDVFVARQNANNFNFFDVDRVEVLRGPQGTLFGRNTTGGAINVIMKKPQADFGGYGEIGFGAYGERMVRASADLPVNDKFLTKISGYYEADNGYVYDPATKQELNANDNKGVRGAVRWLPTSNLTWDLSADYIDDSSMNILNNEVTGKSGRYSYTGMRTDTPATVGVFVNDKANYPLQNKVTSASIISNIGWQTSIGLVSFITGYRNMEQKFALDFFGLPGFQISPVSPTGVFTIANDGINNQFTQEVKLTGDAMSNRLRYVAGLYYFNERNKTDLGQLFAFNMADFGISIPCTSGTKFIPGAVFTLFPCVGKGVAVFNPYYYDRTMRNTTEAWAGYAQADFDFTPSWTLTLGGRYTDEKKTLAYSPNDNPAAPPVNQWSTADIEAAGIPTELKHNQFTPRVALKWTVNDALNFYASATNGFKSGGWNARNTVVDQVQPFEPEKVWSYELGMRSEWLDHTLRFNLTGFVQEVKAFQLPSAFISNGGIVFITRNFADMEVKGIETELVWAPAAGLNLFLNGGWQDAKYKNLNPAVSEQQQACQAALAENDTTGIKNNCGAGIVTATGGIADPVRAPQYTLAVGGSYTFNLGSGYELTPTAYVQNVGKYNVETAGSPLGASNGYTTFNAGISLGNPEQHWALAATCENCGNEYIIASVLAGTQYYNNPRTWSVRFKYTW